MVKRARRQPPAKPARRDDARPAWPVDGHSGEGSASALEMLQKLEKRRVASRPADARLDDDVPPKT